MSLADHLDDVEFSTVYPIDKIVEEKTATITIGAGDPSTPTTSTTTIPHSYGKSAFITFMLSSDNVNYYTQEETLRFSLVTPLSGLGNLTVDAAVDANYVYFYVENFHNEAETLYIKYALDEKE